MKGVVCVLLAFTSTFFAVGQKTNWLKNSDSLSPKKLSLSSGLVAGTWISGTIGLSQVWYNDFQKTSFHTFDDCGDWLQMDKVGHVYTAAHLSEANYRLFKWAGLSDRKSAWIGAGIGLGFQTTLEILDGRNAAWGFSWCDMAANGIGTGLFLSQQIAWNEQRFVLKFSSHLTDYAAVRPSVLGSTYLERLLKDYNGQSYWLSFSPQKFISNWPLPKWICLSFGYSVDQKLAGSEAFFVSNGTVYQAKRQLLFSLDLDVRELPIKQKWLKTLLRPLHYVKFPFPTLLLTGKDLSGKWLYF